MDEKGSKGRKAFHPGQWNIIPLIERCWEELKQEAGKSKAKRMKGSEARLQLMPEVCGRVGAEWDMTTFGINFDWHFVASQFYYIINLSYKGKMYC